MRRLKPDRVPLDTRGLIDRQDIFRVGGGTRRDPAVEIWLTGNPVALRTIARHWFAQMRACGDDVLELMHDGYPVACVGDAPFGYVNTYKRHVNVGFFCGAMLDDPAGMLFGSGKRMRHAKLMPGAELAAEGLRNLITTAYADIKARLDAESASNDG